MIMHTAAACCPACHTWLRLASLVHIQLPIYVTFYCLQARLIEIFDKWEDSSHDIFVFSMGYLRLLLDRVRARRCTQWRCWVVLPLRLFLCCELLHLGRWQDVLLWDLHLSCLLSFFIWYCSTVKFDKIREQFDCVLSVEWVLADGVVPEPKDFKVR